jgi:predicted dehydrogenase
MTEKYRVGIIGCGSIANYHARGYQGVEEIEIVALADPVKKAVDEFGDKYGIESRYTDFRQMLDEESLDIVSNATWHKLHAPITIAACARKPKAVLCEKPMATNLGTAIRCSLLPGATMSSWRLPISDASMPPGLRPAS